jgi:hypothetical protein
MVTQKRRFPDPEWNRQSPRYCREKHLNSMSRDLTFLLKKGELGVAECEMANLDYAELLKATPAARRLFGKSQEALFLID